MAIQYRYEKQDEIPTGLEAEYIEKDGGWVIKDLVGLKPETEFNTVHTALGKERNDHRTTKSKITTLEGTLAERDGTIAELQEAVTGKIDETKISKIVDQRVEQRVAPVKRELDETKQQLTAANTQIEAFQTQGTRTAIKEAVIKAARASHVRDTAEEDAVLLGQSVFEVQNGVVMTKADIAGVTPGISPEVWLTGLKQSRTHWFKESHGGGGGGGGGSGGVTNPWMPGSWNLTEQGRIVQSDRTKAEQLAKAAKSRIGATGPTPVAK